MKLAIRYKDNSFGTAFQGIMEFIYGAYKFNSNNNGFDRLSKAFIVDIINQGFPVFYRTYQHIGAGDNDITGIVSYLNIDESRILINQEVDDFLEQNTWDNSETIILDTSLFSSNIYYI